MRAFCTFLPDQGAADCPATFVMPLDFARLPAIAVVGFILYGETIDIFMIIGSLFILLANSINIRTGIVSQA